MKLSLEDEVNSMKLDETQVNKLRTFTTEMTEMKLILEGMHCAISSAFSCYLLEMI